MLKIPETMASSLEAGVLAQWQREFVAAIRVDRPDAVAYFGISGLEDFVQQAMTSARSIGGISREDLQGFIAPFLCVTMSGSENAMIDFLSMMSAEESFSAKIGFAARAFR